MKRGPDEGGDYDAPRSREAPHPKRRGYSTFVPKTRYAFKALCTEALTSYLLGSRGAIKDEIQQQSNVKIVFSSKGEHFPHTPYRALGIYSDDSACVSRALELIVGKVVELAEDERSRPPPPGEELSGKERGEYQFRLCLSRQMTGLLIGSGGVTVKQLREETGCKIIIDNDTVMGHRLVRLIGSTESLVMCLDRINEFVQRECDTEEFLEYANLLNFGEAAGEPRRDGPESSFAGAYGGRGPSKPTDREVRAAVDLIAEEMVGLPPGTSRLAYSISCSVPAALVGALVGRAGEFVRRVEDQTGAKIDIAREGIDAFDDTRRMSCIGPLLSIYTAQTIMMQRLRDIERESDTSRRRVPASEEPGEASKPEELRATIADLQRQLEEMKGRRKP